MKTNASGLLTVLVRGAAIWIAAHVAVLVIQAGMTLSSVDVGMLWMVGGGGVVLAAVLWLFADVLVRLTMASPQRAPFKSSLTLADWQLLVFSTIGLVLLALAMIELGALAIFWFADTQQYALMNQDDYRRMLLPRVLAEVLRAALGIGLMFGARGLVGLLRRYREFGMPVATAPERDVPASDAPPEETPRA